MTKFYLIQNDSYLKISKEKFFFVKKENATLFTEKMADKIILNNKHSYQFKKQPNKPYFKQLELF